MALLAQEALSRADAAWLHAEMPTNHFVVTSLALLDSPPDLAHLMTLLLKRIAIHPRLLQVVADPLLPLAPPRWVRARRFDLDAHLHRVALPQPGGKAELEAFIGDLAGQPLDFGRPLWSIYAVEGPGKRGAIVTRIHHSLGDGQAMVRMLLTLTDEDASGWRRRPPRRPTPRPVAPRDDRGPATRLLDNLFALPEVARTAVDGAGTLARLTLLDADQASPLRGPLGLLKGVSWTDPIPLTSVKDVARTFGATVNDVVVSAIAGGLGAHLRLLGVRTRGLSIRAMVPVNLRPPGDAGMKGNQFSLVYVELPLGVQDPVDRLARVKAEMDRIKASLEPAAGWLLVQGLGFLPPRLEAVASGFYADKASLVLTNVIGPLRPVYIAGSKIRQMTFWEPQAGGIGVGVSIYSYAGQITIGAVSDRNLVAAPARLTADFQRAYLELAREAVRAGA
jgi:diacylglycerol O-acyltransferase / wax synthase